MQRVVIVNETKQFDFSFLKIRVTFIPCLTLLLHGLLNRNDMSKLPVIRSGDHDPGLVLKVARGVNRVT